MSARTWHKGPPPHIGWWEASTCKAEDMWRWWNGRYWSYAANDFESAKCAGRYAKKKAGQQNLISWTDHYPKNARVPRAAP